eukprot:3972601-Pleurochrysis_carterae.AAC.1
MGPARFGSDGGLKAYVDTLPSTRLVHTVNAHSPAAAKNGTFWRGKASSGRGWLSSPRYTVMRPDYLRRHALAKWRKGSLATTPELCLWPKLVPEQTFPGCAELSYDRREAICSVSLRCGYGG